MTRFLLALVGLLFLTACQTTGDPTEDSAEAKSTAAGASPSDGCSSSAPALDKTGGGLYASHPRDRMSEIGYPDKQHVQFFSLDWIPLTDDDGITYGPNAFYQGTQRKEHPELVVTEDTIEGRWFRATRSDNATEGVYGHFMELLDLALHDLAPVIGFRPAEKMQVFLAGDLEEYTRVTGKGYWVTQTVDGPFLAFEPVDVLFARTLAGHAARHGVALALIDQRTHGMLPPWLREGLASYVAEEGNELVNYVREFRPRRAVLFTPAEVVAHIDPLVDRENGRIAQYNAFLMAWHLAEDYGWDRIKQLFVAAQRGMNIEAAVCEVYGISYEALLERISPIHAGEPAGPDFEPKPPR